MHPTVKRLLGFTALAGAGYAVWRAMEARRVASDVTWDAQPFPYPPQPRTPSSAPKTDAPSSDGTSWVEPDDGTCPTSHPVKAKMSSGIFHVEGGANYDRTNADRCYATPEAAESDGLRASKV
ncbi:MAG: hypothetical protein ABW211_06175 [Acidimicrobiia bacterium]